SASRIRNESSATATRMGTRRSATGFYRDASAGSAEAAAGDTVICEVLPARIESAGRSHVARTGGRASVCSGMGLSKAGPGRWFSFDGRRTAHTALVGEPVV